jgi:hypothetical protein
MKRVKPTYLLRRDVVKVFQCGFFANLHRTARASVLAVVWIEKCMPEETLVCIVSSNKFLLVDTATPK